MIEIIPATDIIGGQCVRLTQGDYASRKTYYRDPLEAAQRFEEAGIRRLHMVDLDGAKASEPRNLAVLERVATKTTLEVQYGGGIKSRGALRSVFDAGASRAICGSIAVREPESFAEWLAEFGGGKLILGADIRDGAVAVQGWAERSEMTAQELIARFAPQGLAQVICTDIARDGMQTGVENGAYAKMAAAFGNPVIVSGGIATAADIRALAPIADAVEGVITGRAIYEGTLTVADGVAACDGTFQLSDQLEEEEHPLTIEELEN